MKSLLSLLTIASLTISVPALLLANAPLSCAKRDIDKTKATLIRNKRENNKVYDFEIKDLEKVRFHFGDRATWTATRLIEVNINKKENSDLNKKLPELKNLNNLTFKFIKSEFSNNQDKQEKIQKLITTFGTKVGMKEWLINKKITIRAKGTILQSNIIDGVTDYSLICTNDFNIELDSIDWVKQQSQFTLVDSTKIKTWTRNDLLTVDGALNIAITNPNIDKVIFDNVLQPQTNKQWNINVKPEIQPRDHQLQVFFTLDGKPFTSEITVSMQAKIDAPAAARVKENLSDVIKFGDENNLGNILDNNDITIISAITQQNPRIIDFSQLEIANKQKNQATLTAKKDSTSYVGSVEVTYNVVPTTIVDLQIDLHPTASEAIVVNDYVGQIDPSNITNPTQTFYYANSESTITIKKPTASSLITGMVYSCDAQWNKTPQARIIDETNGIKLDGSQLDTNNGKYVVELADSLGYTNNIYLQISSKQAIPKYFDTPNGKKFEQWAQANGHDNIRGASVRQLNNLFATSRTWPPQANGSENANSFNPQTANNNLPNNNQSGLTGWAIIGIIVGTLSGMLLLGWLVKKFVVTPLILEPLHKKKAKAFAEQTAKDIAQMKAEEAEEATKRKDEK